jgi:hypothetical protein
MNKSLSVSIILMASGWTLLLLATVKVISQSIILAFVSYGMVLVGSIFGIFTLFQISRRGK